MGAERRALASAAAAFVLLLSGCTGKPPEITRSVTQLLCTQAPEGGAVQEKLSVFLIASDPDGFEDIAAIYLIEDEDEIFWKVDAADWIRTTFEGETWIGTNGIGMPDGSRLPRGEYRILLQDKSGETVETTCTLEGKGAPEGAAFPKATLTAGTISCTGLKESSELWIYDSSDRFVAAYPAEGAPVGVDAVLQQNPGLRQGFLFRLYTYDRQGALGLVSGPYARSP